MTNKTGFPFQNIAIPLDERVKDLVSRFSLDEKIESMVQYQPAIERLGVKAYKHGTEAAHGMAWLGEATSFPQPIGLGCTWNPELMREIGSAIGDEARVFYQRNPEVNGLTLWAPTVDMERDPRWGRTEEAYGEDPKLTGELTAELAQGMQGDHPQYFKAVATLKHFIGNNNEINRGSCSASIDPRNMKEYYQAAFKPAFVKGGARSMMTSYNSVNGIPTIVHEDVKKVVKDEWGMDGFIVSDAGDLLGLVNDHHYYETYKEAVAHSIKAGIDSITDDKEKSCAAIREALAEGLLSESDLDKALFNTFRVRFRLGEFDPAELNPYADTPESKLCAPEHGELSRRAARESIVLLRNEGGLLPLGKDKLSSVAVIGPLADVVYRDWYSGTLPYRATPLDGIRNKLAGVQVDCSSGNDQVRFYRAADGLPILADEQSGNRLRSGLLHETADLFEAADWGWGSWTLTSEKTGKLLTSADDAHIAANADEAFGWFVKEIIRLEQAEQGGDKVALRTWNGKAVHVAEAGQPMTVGGDERPAPGDLLVRETVTDGIAEAKAKAAAADTAIVVVGNNPLINGKEEIDRPGLELPEPQQRLIRAVLEANPNTVVIIVGSYPFALGELSEQIPSIVYMSHAGQELGNALADTLFGDYSPAGRLNMTWYQSAAQLTDIMDYDIIRSKRTYLYLEDEPLYPFGHGLSYADFRYGDLKVDGNIDGLESSADVTVTVTNSSSSPADEVVQLYVRTEGSRVRRPFKKLIAFARVTIGAGETVQVRLSIQGEDLAIWDVTRDRFCLEAAQYTLMAGASSGDIRLTAPLPVQGETIPPRDLSAPTRAENYDNCSAIILDGGEQGGTCVQAQEEEGWLAFHDVDWTKGDSRFIARVKASAAGGALTLRSGSFDGAEIGSAALNDSSSEGGWQTIEIELSGAASGSDLFIALQRGIRLAGFRIQ